MKDLPILFSAPMVRAILAGSKTQTRRALRVQPPANSVQVSTWHHPDPRPMFCAWVPTEDGGAEISDWDPVPCPYGAPGDHLWLREAYRFDKQFDHLPPRDVPAGAPYFMEASRLNWLGGPYDGEPGKLRPGMFMPRWASRITLEITVVRVERLQYISEADALAEGVRHSYGEPFDPTHTITDRRRYQLLWESINGAGAWDANPWVWAVEFKRVTL